ncbi:hypothetical protein Leryth_016795 [Lithospermum erythrorhizon]|nr:hypothetical protein Leryth_016795 [Lithospermum erythrorhizon]
MEILIPPPPIINFSDVKPTCSNWRGHLFNLSYTSKYLHPEDHCTSRHNGLMDPPRRGGKMLTVESDIQVLNCLEDG